MESNNIYEKQLDRRVRLRAIGHAAKPCVGRRRKPGSHIS